MALLHSCLVARVRRPADGEPSHVTLAESNNISGEGTASAPVIAAYHDLLSSKPEAVEARRLFSHVVLIVDNGMRANHEFPDLDAAEAKKEHVAAVRAANEQKSSAEKRAEVLRKQLADAEAAQANAAATLANLTGKPVEPVSNDIPHIEGDPGAVAADPQGGTPVVAPPIGQAPAMDPAAAGASAPSGAESNGSDTVAVEKMAARFEAGESPTAAELGELSEAQLHALAAIYEFEIPEGADKAGIIALFLGADEED